MSNLSDLDTSSDTQKLGIIPNQVKQLTFPWITSETR